MTYAVIEERSAWLSTEFGETLARKYLGDEVIDDMPRYVRGKRKGQIKGKMTWLKVESGGWVRGVYSEIFGDIKGWGVERRRSKIIRAAITIPQWGAPDTLIALYLTNPSPEIGPLDKYHLKENGIKIIEEKGEENVL
tara:strand:+ start:222 stop:635 length:414 start_codon:yes stop_codon:yes gene_type:complete